MSLKHITHEKKKESRALRWAVPGGIDIFWSKGSKVREEGGDGGVGRSSPLWRGGLFLRECGVSYLSTKGLDEGGGLSLFQHSRR